MPSSTPRELLEARDVVPRKEAVDERQRCAHPARERLVLGIALERVHPDDGVGGSSELRHLARDELVVLPLPAVGDDDDDRAA